MSGIASISQLGAQVPGVRETPMEHLAQQEKTGSVAGAEHVEDKSALEQKEKSSVPIVDEYVHGEKPLPTGLYRLAKDGEGKQKIIFDDPSKPNDEKVADEPAKADEDKKAEEKCTTNTDKVDAEIKKLKEKKEKLEQQLQQAADDPDKQEKLQRQLQQTEREISMKDNDSYRRQHAEYTFGE